jgi:hypothetical protein
MNLNLGLRALAIVLLVATCTAVLVTPELVGGTPADNAPAIMALLVLGRN